MQIPSGSTRRTVLKTLGAGAVAVSVSSGLGIAGPDDPCDTTGDVTDSTILLHHAEFDPECSSVTPGDSSAVTVTFENGEGEPYGVHNIVVHGSGGRLKSSALNPQEQSGVKYQIAFTDNGDGTFDAWETNEFGNAGSGKERITGISYNAAELEVHCDLHDKAGDMDGTINATEP